MDAISLDSLDGEATAAIRAMSDATGYARAEDRARALAAGFQVHAPKPVEPATLTAAIAAMTGHPSQDGRSRQQAH